MGWLYRAVLTAVLIGPAAASAADKPDFGAPAAWIKPLAAPALSGMPDAAALHVLLRDVQLSFHGDTSRTFNSNVVQVAKPEGLAALGTFALAWKPETDRVTVHWLRIRRGDKLIDVLDGGKNFTVLRREQNLELAAIDGVLTATMPIPGLQVGDTIEMAWTIEHTEPLMKGHHDLALDAGTGGNIARLRFAAQWDGADRMIVRSQNLPAALDRTPVSLSLATGPLEPLILPQGAPLRFRLGRMIEMSDFADWASVSAIFAPLFGTARQLKAGSPLIAEIARIKAAAPDPATRAGLALKLVEDNIRYLYIGLNDSNLRPAAADDTWQRRFGDCKAKTALLLSLLDGLGIAADPALVSTRLGDGLDHRLPNATQFDHVIVRATIVGKVYWLDGTRLGDTRLADLTVPDFHWALPVKSAGGALESLVVAPRDQPDTITDLRLDASKGIMAPAGAHAEVSFSSDAGMGMHAALAAVSQGALDQQLRKYWAERYDFITPQKVSESWDASSRTERLVMDGTARMAWDAAGNGQRRYQLDGAQVGWHGDFRRQPGPDSDAPFALGYPWYSENRETVMLPDGGHGFSLSGENVDETLARYAIYRHAELAGDRVTMVTRQRPLAPELPYGEAQAANDHLRALADGAVDIMLDDKQYMTTTHDATALLALPVLQGETGYQSHIQAYLTVGDAARGLAEARRYAAAFPQSPNALGARAMFEAATGMDRPAMTDAAAALAIAPATSSAKMVTGYYQQMAADAKDSGTRPGFLAAMKWGTAQNCARQHDYACARQNAEAALALQPDLSMVYVLLANASPAESRTANAIQVADRMVKTAPRDADMQAVAGVIYASVGQHAKGLAAFSASLAIKPNFIAFSNRERFLPRGDLAARKRDIDGALKLKPGDVDAQLALARWQGDSGDHAGQVATLQAVAARQSADIDPNIGLTIKIGAAYAAAGQADKARESFAEGRGYAAAMHSAPYFNDLCYSATKVDFDLDTALADCNRAVSLAPQHSNILDSLGFVQLRLGHFADAIATYDQVLALDPHARLSLYGRGIARLRLGDKTGSQADIAAAVQLDDGVADEFQAMGMKP